MALCSLRHIDINRDKDGYGVIIAIVDMQMNRSLTNEQFHLRSPKAPNSNNRGSGRFSGGDPASAK